jgi:hypothetical protein
LDAFELTLGGAQSIAAQTRRSPRRNVPAIAESRRMSCGEFGFPRVLFLEGRLDPERQQCRRSVVRRIGVFPPYGRMSAAPSGGRDDQAA